MRRLRSGLLCLWGCDSGDKKYWIMDRVPRLASMLVSLARGYTWAFYNDGWVDRVFAYKFEDGSSRVSGGRFVGFRGSSLGRLDDHWRRKIEY